jgi:hypothetical protein
VLIHGVQTTAELDWPYDPDHFRDIAQAQTIRDGSWRQDPFYRGESVWYNPMLAATVAAISYLTGQPVHSVYTRAGAYLNIAAPLAFYVLVVRLIGPAVALASLVGFLFVVQGPTWAAPTYSPWFFASVFAQPFFYLTLAASYSALETDRWWRYALSGVLLGFTFLAHMAPAMMAGACILVFATHVVVAEKRSFAALAGRLALIFGLALLFSLPFLWSIAGHYGLRIKNPVPLLWSDPQVAEDRWRAVWMMLTPRGPLHTMILLGVVAMAMGRVSRRAVVIVTAWLGASIGFFAYSTYAAGGGRRFLPPIVPAHHFLVYERAVEMILFGLGVFLVAAGIGRMAWGALHRRFPTHGLPPTTDAVLGVLLAAVVWTTYPSFLTRDAFGPDRDTARAGYTTRELRDMQPWIRSNTGPLDVFLTSDSACLSIVGPAGRKCVLAPLFFSNPYVDWNQRRIAHQAMWDALVAEDCRTFREHAYAYGVKYVMTVETRTPPVPAGRCGLMSTSFKGSNWQIYRAFRF